MTSPGPIGAAEVAALLLELERRRDMYGPYSVPWLQAHAAVKAVKDAVRRTKTSCDARLQEVEEASTEPVFERMRNATIAIHHRTLTSGEICAVRLTGALGSATCRYDVNLTWKHDFMLEDMRWFEVNDSSAPTALASAKQWVHDRVAEADTMLHVIEMFIADPRNLPSRNR